MLIRSIYVLTILFACDCAFSQVNKKYKKHSLEVSYTAFSFFDGTPLYVSKKIYGVNSVQNNCYGLKYSYSFDKSKQTIGLSIVDFGNVYYKDRTSQKTGDIIDKHFLQFSTNYSYLLGYKKKIKLYANIGLVGRVGYDAFHVYFSAWERRTEGHLYRDIGISPGLQFSYALTKRFYLVSTISYIKYVYLKQEYGEHHYIFDKGVSTNNFQYEIGFGCRI